MRHDSRPTMPVPPHEAAMIARAEAEFRAADSQEWAYRMTAFLRVHATAEQPKEMK